MNWFKSFWKRLTTPASDAPQAPGRSPEPGRFAKREARHHTGDFTPRAMQVLALARKEADRFHHSFVGTEHLLLGLIALGQGTAVAVMTRMGLDLGKVREEVENQVGTGPDEKCRSTIPYTPRVKKVLALAAKEAAALNHTYVGTEHILLGLLREGDGVAARVLRNLGVDVEQARMEILRELDSTFTGSADTGGVGPSSTPKPAAPAAPFGPRQPLDISMRFDIHCAAGDEIVIYRNALFKGTRSLFQTDNEDVPSEFLELEQNDGRTVFVARSSVIKFHEHDPAA
jgi:hypothetical protein